MIGRNTLKQILISLLGGILFLTACGQAPTSNIPTALISATELNTIQNSTASPLPTKTPRERVNEPTITPHPPTPLPTIPTFTPTFDASTIITATPAPTAECPQEDPTLIPDLNTFFNQEGLRSLKDQALLNFLNEGGAPRTVITAFLREFKWFHPDMIIQKDLTGDGVAELILTENYFVYVFGCKDKQYQTLLSDIDELGWMQEIQFKIVKDMNLNGIPEILTIEYGGHAYTSISASIFEWTGSDFSPLIQGESYGDNKYSLSADTSVPAQAAIYDTDGNGTLELVLESNLPMQIPSLYAYLIPWRTETDIYDWNGTHYILNRTEYTSPEFRFQALQDADREVGYGNFDKALLFYQAVISNNKLKVFSPEIAENEIAKSFAIDGSQPVPTPFSPDLKEYPRLAAYAYYRIMLLHIVQGRESDAGTVYKTLQQKFGSNEYGRPYVEMAAEFWDIYQPTHKMYDGCAAAIQYAAEHPEILTPLGSDYHGSQSHIYVPADVCPFR
jgi:hypothetical protein